MTYWLTFAAPDGDDRTPPSAAILFGYVEDRVDAGRLGTVPQPHDDDAEVPAWTGPRTG
jgi:hypothetical protein